LLFIFFQNKILVKAFFLAIPKQHENGFIIHESETIGSFIVMDEPRYASNLMKWIREVYDKELEATKR